jgi:hypothetical protein
MTGKQADRVAWAVLYFLLAVGGFLITLGVAALAHLVF